MKNQLAPDDRLSLDTLLHSARADQAAQQWISNPAAIEGPPLQDRIASLPADAPVHRARQARRSKAS